MSPEQSVKIFEIFFLTPAVCPWRKAAHPSGPPKRKAKMRIAGR
jgi:hypothetical protein